MYKLSCTPLKRKQEKKNLTLRFFEHVTKSTGDKSRNKHVKQHHLISAQKWNTQ